MAVIEVLLLIVAGLLAITAIIFHFLDHDRDYGTTMGGDMLVGQLWSICSLASAIAIAIHFHWLVFFPSVIAVYVVGRLGVHWLVEKLMFKFGLGRVTSSS